jgi:hypothetical protein
VVAGAEDVGECQQGRHEGRVRRDRELDEGAVGERDADRFGLATLVRLAVPEVGLGVDTGGVQALAAELAGAVGDRERGDDQVALLDGGHRRAGVLDDADELVAHPCGTVCRGHRAVRPQVAAADARGGDADERVSGLLDHRIRHILDADVAGGANRTGDPGHQIPELSAGVPL